MITFLTRDPITLWMLKLKQHQHKAKKANHKYNDGNRHFSGIITAQLKAEEGERDLFRRACILIHMFKIER